MLSYRALYVISRLVLNPKQIFRSFVDGAIFFYVAWTTLSLSWGLYFGADPGTALSDWLCVASLLFYFPTRDYVERTGTTRTVVIILLALALFAAVRNLINYRQVVIYATIGWEFKSRVTTNEILLVSGCVGYLTLAVRSMSWTHVLLSLTAFSISFISLIVTQTRAFWVAFAFGFVWILLLRGGRERFKLMTFSFFGGIFLTVFTYLILGDVVFTLALGILERALTIGSSVSKDLSLISRFYEADAALELFWQNPLAGWGPGGTFRFYDIIEDATIERTFIHNGYVGLLFKAGLIGTIPILTAWAILIVRGLWLSAKPKTSAWTLTPSIILVAMLLPALTAMQFYAQDIAFVFALCSGCVAGASSKA